MDKIWWNELWMSWPVGPHYEEQSNVTNTHKLEGDLLLIVGELDRKETVAIATRLIRSCNSQSLTPFLNLIPNLIRSG